MKKIIIFWILTILLFINLVIGQNYIEPSIDNPRNPYNTTNNTNLISPAPNPGKTDELAKSYILGDDGRKSLLEKIADILGIKPLVDNNKQYAAIEYIKSIINFFLAILGFVALVVLIIWFAKMLLSFGKSQEAIDSAKKYILAAIIAILLIGLSWFIISWIFTIIYR